MSSVPPLRIVHVVEPSPEVHTAINGLIAELSSSASPLSEQAFAELLSHPSVQLFVAFSGEQLIGMLTLATFPVPTGLRAWIEDVAVTESARGSGAGSLLVRTAVEHAKEAGARTVELTSRPSRVAANRLYQRLGFEPRETNVYRIKP